MSTGKEKAVPAEQIHIQKLQLKTVDRWVKFCINYFVFNKFVSITYYFLNNKNKLNKGKMIMFQ